LPPTNQDSWKHSQTIRKLSPSETGCFLLLAKSFRSFQKSKNFTKISPAFAALMAGEFLLVSPKDGVYSIEKIKKWRTGNQWRFQGHHQLPEPPGLIHTGTAYPKKERTVL
jgi:hypothetical protein